MTIQLDSHLAERLQFAAQKAGKDPNHFAVAAIERAISGNDESDVDDALTEEERAQVLAGLQRGLADSDAGRVATAETFYARMNQKYGIFGASSTNE